MKFICSQSDLNTHLSLVSRAVPSRPTHPVLGNVLFTADDQTQRVNLTGFDLSLGIHTSFGAEVSEPGKLTLPAKLLNDIVSRLPEGEITLASVEDEAEDKPFDNAQGKDCRVLLSSASGRFQLRGMAATEFPELPVVQDGEALMLPVVALTEGLHGCLFASSADETKQVLTGVHLASSPDGLEFAATDGHRLAVVQTDLENSEFRIPNSEFNMTIPARALRELERMMAMRQGTDSVALHIDESQLIFELGDQHLTSRKLEGAYPAYEQLIPKQFARTVTVERKRLLTSLELVAVLADQKNNMVKCSLDSDNGQLTLSVEAQDIGSAKQSMPAEIMGESTEIAFNVKYFMDGLKAIPAADIQIQLNEGDQPVIFTPLGGLQMTYLVMPVQIRN